MATKREATPEAALAEWSSRGLSAAAVLKACLAGAVMGTLVVVFVISFATIIYSGEMAHELSRGLGLTLAGAAVMAVLAAFTLSYRGTIAQPQDVTTLILSLGVASLAGDWTGPADGLFPTVAVFIAVTAALTGLLGFIAGKVRLGFMVRFIPYPVLGGFLAATALLILLGAAGMAAGRSVDLWTIADLFEPGVPAKWLPWLAYAVALYWAVRRFRHWLVLPGCIFAGLVSFYVVLWATGGTLASAREAGLLLGPFEGESLAIGLGPWILSEADWRAVVGQAPTMMAVAGMAIVGMLLNVSALGIAIDRDLDANRDLRAMGAANVASALVGGMPGYHMLTPTILSTTLGLTSSVAGLAVAGFSAWTLFFGAEFLSVLPVGVFAGLLLFIAIDKLYDWFWEERRRLPLRDFAVVVSIAAVAATVGFLQAIAFGLVTASILFIIAYARIDTVRLRASAASLRSRVERPDAELRWLTEVGDCAAVYQLAGYLFFGTASRLIDEVQAHLADAGQRPRFVLLDFRRVSGMDASAIFALGKLHRRCAGLGVDLVLTGLTEALRQEVAGAALGDAPPLRVFSRLDQALRDVEERLLAEHPSMAGLGAGLLDQFVRRHPSFNPSQTFRSVSIAPGEVLFEQGSSSDGMALLLSGCLRAEIVGQDGSAATVATIRPGTLVGEVGLYAGVPRTARVVAEEPSRLLIVDDAALEALERENPLLLADFHRLAASHLAQRLTRMNTLLREAETS